MNASYSRPMKVLFKVRSGTSAPSHCKRLLRLFAAIWLVLWLAKTAQAGTIAPTLTAKTACAWGSDDCNRCVPDAIDAIQRLRDHGDPMGFHMNGAPDVDLFHHWQGIQRLTSGGGRFVAVSRSLESEGDDVAFVIVEMASRNTEGERFRSNRLSPISDFADTPPPADDKIVSIMPHEAGFTHAGAMQSLGNILAVPFEESELVPLVPGCPCFMSGCECEYVGSSKVVLYDVADPMNPLRLPNEVDHSPLSYEAGTASLGRLADGRVLLIIGRSNANILDFYVSTGTDLRTTGFEWFDTWNEGELNSEIGDFEFGNYQNLNLLAQCDGTFYLIGTHENTAIGIGEDFVDLYRLENGTGDDVSITKVAKKHVFCDYRGEANCNLDAAGGIYVDPEGRLYIYGTEHDNDGPSGAGSSSCQPAGTSCSGPACSVKMAEFRPVPHGSCARIQDAWVELYDDSGFEDRGVMIDFVDRYLKNYANLNQVEDIEDKPSAVRWCIPPGYTYRLWQDRAPCSGDTLDLVGTGILESIADLDDVGFGDDASCSEWLGGPAPALSITYNANASSTHARCGTCCVYPDVTHSFSALSSTHDSATLDCPGGPAIPASGASFQLDAVPSPTDISISVRGSASLGEFITGGGGAIAEANANSTWDILLSGPTCFTLRSTLNLSSTEQPFILPVSYFLAGLNGPSQIILDTGTPPDALDAFLIAPGCLSRTASGRLLGGPYRIQLSGAVGAGSFPYSGSFAGTVVLTIHDCPGDCDADGEVDLDNHDLFVACLTGPIDSVDPACNCFDFDEDGDADLADFAVLQEAFTGL